MDRWWINRGLGWRALSWTVAWALFDLAVRHAYPGHENALVRCVPYLLGLGLSWLTARLTLELLGRIPGVRLRCLAAFPLCLLWTCILMGSGYLFRFFGEYITGGGLLFVLSEPDYLRDYVSTFATVLSVLGFFSAMLAIAFFLVPGSVHSGRRMRGATLALFALAWGLGVVFLGRDSVALPPDAAGLCAAPQAFRLGVNRLHLQKVPRRLPSLAHVQEPWARTIVVVVNESWGTTGAAFVDNTPDGLPLLHGRLRSDSDWAVFPHAFTNATSTDVSMPSIFTGSRTDDSWERLHAWPFPWDIAHARGYRTAYVTSQRLKWQNLESFLFPSGIDEKWSMENLGAPVVNDAGIDDMVSARKVSRILRDTPRDKPLFLVWNTNSLHGPFQEKSEFVATDSVRMPGRWFKALRILDVATDTVLSALKASGRMEDALVLMTGDHGEIEEPHHRPARIYNYYDEIVRIPFLVHFPAAWRQQRPQAVAALRTNQRRNVQNLDIAPTLAVALGLRADRKNDSLFGAWKGTPLVDPVDSLREIMVLSANEIHTGNREGFGLIQGSRRLVLTNLEGLRLFDIRGDSLQTRDLWPGAEPSERARWLSRIDAEPLTKRIFLSAQALVESNEAQGRETKKH